MLSMLLPLCRQIKEHQLVSHGTGWCGSLGSNANDLPRGLAVDVIAGTQPDLLRSSLRERQLVF
jgi:hypothetical protein